MAARAWWWLALVWGLCLVGDVAAGEAATPGAWAESFAAATLPHGWQAVGKGGSLSLTPEAPYAGERSLRLERPENLQNEKLEVAGPAFPAAPGRWKFSGGVRSALHSPDNSFCVRLHVEALGGGKPLGRLTITEQTGRRNWRAFAQTVELPAGTDAARLVATFEKTFGTCDFAALAAAPAGGKQEPKLVDGIRISTPAFGNLLLPEDEVKIAIEIRTLRPMPEGAAATAVVTDYWGAEWFPAEKLTLAAEGQVDGRHRYRAAVVLPRAQVELGKYYECHVSVAAPGFAPAREHSAFARLPEAESRRCSPKDIPFTIRSWDNRVPAYMKLASRLGHRNLGTWGGWDAKDPTKVHVPTLELCRELGNDWVTGTPASDVERNGFRNYSEENLREGTKNFLKKYAGQGLSYICLGNEPPERPDKIAEKVRAYRAVYEAAKEVAPEIPIIATSVPPLKTFFEAGYHKYCDIYDFHVYETYENVRQAIRRYKELMKEYGAEKPIFCTELGLNSQGQTRLAVAQEVVKKITAFFAEGGANVSWFGIEYPDGEGKARGSSGNSHNVFDCQYCLYNPRLDAIMYYNMINGITVKKFVSEVQHPEGVQDFLFRDDAGNAFHVLWREAGRKVCGLSLPGVDAVRLIRIDGSGVDMAPENGVLTVTVSPEPILLRYRRPDAKLAEKLAAPAFNASFAPQVPQGVPVDYLWRLYDIREEPPILKGQGVVITLAGAGLRAADFRAVMPPGWKAEFKDSGQEDGISYVHCVVTVPPETAARVGRVMIQKLANGRPCGELCLPLTLMSPLTVAVVPAPVGPDGKPRLAARLANHGAEAREVSWAVELEAAFGIARGVFNLEKPEHCDAYLKGESEGAAKLAGLVESMLTGQSERVAFLTIEDCDPQTIYRVRATVTDERGGRVTQARYVGGFAEAKRAAAPVAVDGKLDEPAWAQAKV
ncbi:MAG: hypothetical protein J6333_05870, partial [Planctomycetes bacterium]|nr:hypothetical protein [Planctomycetota bacterium]